MLSQLKQYYRLFRLYKFDFFKDIKYSTLRTTKYTSQEKLVSSLVVTAHTIEKGLTMPNKKQYFGIERVEMLANDCAEYVKKGYDVNEPRFIYVVGIIKEWSDFIGKERMSGNATAFLSQYPEIKKTCQLYDMSRKDFFSKTAADFRAFSESRHTCRSLAGHIDDNQLNEVLSLAMRAPSTCNRQSVRIHVLRSEEAKKAILQIQSGSRGFGDSVDQFLLITADLSDWPSMHQRNAPYVDGGIFVMQLLYSLHYYNIAACTLNLYLDVNRTNKFHQSLHVPENEVPIALIAVGVPPEQFDVALSEQRNYKSVTNIH